MLVPCTFSWPCLLFTEMRNLKHNYGSNSQPKTTKKTCETLVLRKQGIVSAEKICLTPNKKTKEGNQIRADGAKCKVRQKANFRHQRIIKRTRTSPWKAGPKRVLVSEQTQLSGLGSPPAVAAQIVTRQNGPVWSRCHWLHSPLFLM